MVDINSLANMLTASNEELTKELKEKYMNSTDEEKKEFRQDIDNIVKFCANLLGTDEKCCKEELYKMLGITKEVNETNTVTTNKDTDNNTNKRISFFDNINDDKDIKKDEVVEDEEDNKKVVEINFDNLTSIFDNIISNAGTVKDVFKKVNDNVNKCIKNTVSDVKKGREEQTEVKPGVVLKDKIKNRIKKDLHNTPEYIKELQSTILNKIIEKLNNEDYTILSAHDSIPSAVQVLIDITEDTEIINTVDFIKNLTDNIKDYFEVETTYVNFVSPNKLYAFITIE